MKNDKGKGNLVVLASAVGGISIGWLAVDYMTKRQRLGAHESILQRMKNFEKRLYADGEKRANNIERIKREIKDKVVE